MALPISAGERRIFLMVSPPAAAGVRLAWAGLPERIRSAVEARAGAAVVAARDQRGGFSPGVAARLLLDDGSRLFVKAVALSVNADSARMHRNEARTLAALPPEIPAPRLRWTYDDGEWIVLGIEDVEGHSPALPWRRDDLERVIAALPAAPAPEDFVSLTEQLAGAFTGWRTLAAERPADLDPWALRHLDRLVALEASWAVHADGGMLLHSDLRADNLIIGADGDVHLVDWAHACSGAPWVDLVLLLAEVDRSRVDPDEILVEAGAPPEGVDALLCAFAGFLAERCRRPAPPGLPTIRAYQRAYAASTLGWLARRTGWDGSVWALG
jgi:aminoglycoside phosphotransferase (APT) family kinase protein